MEMTGEIRAQIGVLKCLPFSLHLPYSVSLKPNSTYIEVYNMICNGSHGISIGSLGQYAGESKCSRAPDRE